jgi:glycosyltransferase involved in cell wall biosynthesis
MEYRPFHFGREWVTAGHRVTVVGASFSHLRGHQPHVSADLQITEEQGVRFCWLRTTSYHGNGVARLLNMLNFIGKLHFYADEIGARERPDAVICSSTYPLDIYAGAQIARRAGARLVFEEHDLWPLTPVLLGGYSPRHPYIRLLQRAEHKAYRIADLVVSVLPNTKEHMVAGGLDPEKFVHIPNGIPISQSSAHRESCLPAELKALISQERVKGRFLIGYAGGINLNMDLGTVLDAAVALSKDHVSFVIAGHGSQAGVLRDRLNQYQLNNFHMVGPISKASVPAFLAQMDVLTIPWHRNPLYKYGISPNKLFEYMLAGRPVLQSSEASNDPVTEANCGWTIPPEDAAAFVRGIRRIQSLPIEHLHDLGENGRRFARQKHDCRVLARYFLKAIRREPLFYGDPHPVANRAWNLA